jgi:hypothetical protein
MNKRVVLFIFAAASIPSAFAAIDFTPATGERELDGIKFSQLIFHDKGRRVSYEQPRGWTYSGDSSYIRFIPPGTSLAVGEISQVPIPAAQNFDDEATKTWLLNQVLTGLPTDSREAKLISVEKNPLMINGQDTLEITVAYTLHGENYLQSVLFLHLADVQLNFRFISRKTDFPKLHQAFRGSLCSLQWL